MASEDDFGQRLLVPEGPCDPRGPQPVEGGDDAEQGARDDGGDAGVAGLIREAGFVDSHGVETTDGTERRSSGLALNPGQPCSHIGGIVRPLRHANDRRHRR